MVPLIDRLSHYMEERRVAHDTEHAELISEARLSILKANSVISQIKSLLKLGVSDQNATDALDVASGYLMSSTWKQDQ